MNKRKSTDWESIEKDWRAGIKTKLEMSQQYGVSRAAIDKHFAKLGIERDLSEKIRQKAEALVTQQVVTQQVTQARLVTTERDIIESNARVRADVLISQRGNIARGRKLAMALFAELEAETADPESFEQLGELLQQEGVDKLNELYRRVIALPSRIDSAKKLSETLKNLIALERQALGMSDGPLPDETVQYGRIEWVVRAHRPMD